MPRLQWTLVVGIVLFLASLRAAAAEVLVFQCALPAFSSPLFVTVYDDGSPARIGVQQGVGSKAHAYYDKKTDAWILVELAADLPTTLTTILKDGTIWHSRHTLAVDGTFVPSQSKGTCTRRSISGVVR